MDSAQFGEQLDWQGHTLEVREQELKGHGAREHVIESLQLDVISVSQTNDDYCDHVNCIGPPHGYMSLTLCN